MTIQEQEESQVFERFVRLYTDRQIIAFKKQESPDFIVQLEGKTIGVEVTEVFQDSSSEGPSKLQQNSADWARFANELILEIQPYIDFKFSVSIHYSRFYPIGKPKKRILIQKIRNICIHDLKGLPNCQHLILDYSCGLPKQFDSIYFKRLDGIGESFNRKVEGGVISDLKSEHLTTLLTKKERQLKDYNGCDHYWLLIMEGNYYAGSFSKVDIALPIDSSFEKVFLIRTREDQLIQLK